MRNQWNVVVVALVATTLLGGPSLAGDRDRVQTAATERQAQDFEAIASYAAQESSAPDTFAPCVRGMAAGTYPCDGIDMMSHLSRADLGLSFVNDMWGWTDPQTRKDYALIGGTEGTVIVDISDPKRPDVVGTLPAHTLDPNRPFWRDIKVFANHMYVVSEQLLHGLQVFDLTRVRGVSGAPVVFTEDAHYGDFTAHNININEDTGFLYVVGARNPDRSLNCGGGLHMVDINSPTSPGFAGCFEEHGYIHDTQCVVYRGPDGDHRGKEICFNSNNPPSGSGAAPDFVSIVDVTDKSSPVSLARVDYPNSGFSHQGWLTPDQSHFLHGDELDEVNHGIGTTTRVWDVRDLDDPSLIGVFENDTTSIDHNLYTEGRVAFASNYTSGLRVYDLGRVDEGELSESAFFDVYPENDNASFEGGTWSNFPYYRQKKIVAVSSIDRGLFVLRPRGGVGG
jgi:choice-of-anchor B domain-containing protein